MTLSEFKQCKMQILQWISVFVATTFLLTTALPFLKYNQVMKYGHAQ